MKEEYTNSGIIVSIIMPLYNEEKYISNCIDSLLRQTFCKKNMEWIFVDGNSTDNTLNILKSYQKKYPDLIHIYNNPKKIVPHAMNIGIKHAMGKYIIRLDAHADYNYDYIDKCVYYLEHTDADNVGGIARTKSNGFIGDAIAMMLSSKFGVGNSQFRINGSSGYVDTVPFGAFRREVFERLGGYDERLIRNQDNEMNYRIRKNGGKIFLSQEIQFTYYCRDTILGLVDMAIKNGKWNIITTYLCPGSMGIRHFIPLVFLMSLCLFIPLAFLSNLFLYLLGLELLLYFGLGFIFAVKATIKVQYILLIIVLFPVFHLSYGYGSLIGILNLVNYALQYSIKN